MNVEITGRHTEVTNGLRTYVLKRLRKFSRVLPEPLKFHVILGAEKDRQTAEILLKTKALDLTGTGETKDMFQSITRALDKLERQALKQRHRIIETRRKRAKENALAAKSGIAAAPVTARPRRSRDVRSNGIREEEAQSKPMVLEEAMLELRQSEYPFVVFRNAESGGVNVLYRRKDGSLGLIHA